ncbi:cytochrome c oxidase assembly protein [Pseudomarimonas salicorniae]|uniref:Cytochrome c oxidase assembly protein CtaG n=1 Tax=Pseudomarimonas salicorniae TaxID=2933270 RepID=A0ABT0GHZ5_9GAMM|nr:cytochrome c oxidase assembly protein [Lysobacter sp. CAU 1642]
MSPTSRHVLRRAAFASLAAFTLAFALVPIYRIACEKLFGIRFEEGPAEVRGFEADLSREVVVEFDTSVNSKLPWSFRYEVPSMKVNPGVLTEAIFYARNDSDKPIVGQAVPSVAPSSAAIYFNKTECFCFTEQLLAPGEERAMPVRFVVDPALPGKTQTLTLSYTFYNNDLATRRVREQAGTLAGSH